RPKRGRATQFDALYARFDPHQPWDAAANAEAAGTAVHLFLCPSHPRYDAGVKSAPTYYVGSAGVGADAAYLPEGAARAGFFGYERRLHVERKPGSDELPAGTSHTLMVAETTRDNGPWAAGDRSTVRPLDPSDTPYVGPDRQFGGFHPGGANLLMV